MTIRAVGEQIGLFVRLSRGSWPHHAIRAFSGIFSPPWSVYVDSACYMLGLMVLADKYGSRMIGELLAMVRKLMRTMIAKGKIFVLWMLSLGFVVIVFAGALPWLLIAVPIIRFIGAIKTSVLQASAFLSVALLIGLGWGFSDEQQYKVVDFECRGDKELVMRSGERLACITMTVDYRRKLMVVRGPTESTLVWQADVEPASWRRALGGS